MALAGIIVGFTTIALILFALAIPAFLGVRAASNDQSVTHLPLTPIVLGQPVEGGNAPPVPWQSESPSSGTTLTAVPRGVDMTIANADQAEWAGVPAAGMYQTMALSATVAISAGPQSNAIGLACITPARTEQIVFVIRNSGLWQVELLTSRGPSIIDSGISPVIHSTGGNALTIGCGNDPASAGKTLLAFEINRTPVSDDVVDLAFPEWTPALQLCSCDGPGTGTFLNVSYYGPSSSSST